MYRDRSCKSPQVTQRVIGENDMEKELSAVWDKYQVGEHEKLIISREKEMEKSEKIKLKARN